MYNCYIISALVARAPRTRTYNHSLLCRRSANENIEPYSHVFKIVSHCWVHTTKAINLSCNCTSTWLDVKSKACTDFLAREKQFPRNSCWHCGRHHSQLTLHIHCAGANSHTLPTIQSVLATTTTTTNTSALITILSDCQFSVRVWLYYI